MGATPNQPTPEEGAEGFEVLLNGRDLTGRCRAHILPGGSVCHSGQPGTSGCPVR
jgi:hypothetical protein